MTGPCKNIRFQQVVTANTLQLRLFGEPENDIDQIRVSDVSGHLNNDYPVMDLVACQSQCLTISPIYAHVGQMIFENVNDYAGNIGANRLLSVSLGAGGTVDNLIVRNILMNFSTANTSGKIVQVEGAGTINNLVLDSITQPYGNAGVTILSGGAVNEIRASNISSTTSYFINNNSNNNVEVYLTNSDLNNAGGSLRVATGTGNFVLHSAGNNSIATCFARSGTQTLTPYNAYDCKVDLSTSGITPVIGGGAYNTNAGIGSPGAIGVGPAISFGTTTGAWHSLNPANAANSY